MADGYGDAKDMGTGYFDSRNAPGLQANSQPQSAASAPAAPSAPLQPAPLDGAKAAADMQAYFAKDYVTRFFGGNRTEKLRVGRKIPIELVSDAGMETVLKQQVAEVIERYLRAKFKYNMPDVKDRLSAYFKTEGRPYPYAVNDPTVKGLSKGERGAVFGATGSGYAGLTREAKVTVALYMRPPPETPNGPGKMILRRSTAEDRTQQPELAGAIAHELAHAYADPGWWDLLDLMDANNQHRTGQLSEGTAVHFEEILLVRWLKLQPAGTKLPRLGYDDQPTVAITGQDFIDAVGNDAFQEAYFGGWIGIADPKNPEKTIEIGRKKVHWEWQWHVE